MGPAGRCGASCPPAARGAGTATSPPCPCCCCPPHGPSHTGGQQGDSRVAAVPRTHSTTRQGSGEDTSWWREGAGMLTELLLSAAAPAWLWWAPQGLLMGGSEVWHGHGQGGWVWPQLLSSLALLWVSPSPLRLSLCAPSSPIRAIPACPGGLEGQPVLPPFGSESFLFIKNTKESPLPLESCI